MIKDILENAQLFALSTWNGVIDAISPNQAKRETIRIGLARVQRARGEYRAVDALLHQEATQLATNHKEERKLLSVKQGAEREQMRDRHATVRAGAQAELRTIRSSVVTTISGTEEEAQTAPSIGELAAAAH